MLTFGILAVVMTVGAIGVITLRQPVHAALSLVGTLLTLAVTYVTLQAHFLAAIQVIVYAGAIMVLFLFVIMLLNVQGERGETSRWLRPAAYLVGLVAAASIAVTVFLNPDQLPNVTVVNAALAGGGAGAIGTALFEEFVLAFQLVGVLLLTGIVGAVSLVQRRAEEDAAKAEPVREPVLARAGSGGRYDFKPAAAVADADDLKRISGVGPKLEKLLHRNGIRTFEQLASLSPQEVEKLDDQLESFKGRIYREDWLAQAEELAQEKQQ